MNIESKKEAARKKSLGELGKLFAIYFDFDFFLNRK